MDICNIPLNKKNQLIGISKTYFKDCKDISESLNLRNVQLFFPQLLSSSKFPSFLATKTNPEYHNQKFAIWHQPIHHNSTSAQAGVRHVRIQVSSYKCPTSMHPTYDRLASTVYAYLHLHLKAWHLTLPNKQGFIKKLRLFQLSKKLNKFL